MIRYDKPDYKSLAQKSLVTAREAIWFLTYPELLLSEFVGGPNYSLLAESFFNVMRKDFCNALNSNEFSYIADSDGCARLESGEKIYDIDKVLVHVSDVCRWALSKDFELPDELKKIGLKVSAASTTTYSGDKALSTSIEIPNNSPHVQPEETKLDLPDTIKKEAKEALVKEIYSEKGRNKGKRKDKVLKEITKHAITELDAGCKCHNSELARYLMKLTNRDCTRMYILPSINENQYETHFRKATNIAFKSKGIRLRNEPETLGEPRGKKYCERPGHNAN